MGLRHFIKLFLVTFIILALLSLITFFVSFPYEFIVYILFGLNFLVLYGIYIKKKAYRGIGEIISSVFEMLLLVFFVVLIIDVFYPIEFLNLNYFLIVVVVFGVLTFFIPQKKRTKNITKKDYFMIFFVSIAGGVFIYGKVRELGWLAFIVGIVSALLIGMLSTLILEET